MARWGRGEYGTSTILRFTLLISLWILYGLIPYYLPLESLFLISAALLAYAILLWRRGETFFSAVIFTAFVLNNVLVLYLGPGFNLFLTIIITALLVFEIINAPE